MCETSGSNQVWLVASWTIPVEHFPWQIVSPASGSTYLLCSDTTRLHDNSYALITGHICSISYLADPAFSVYLPTCLPTDVGVPRFWIFLLAKCILRLRQHPHRRRMVIETTTRVSSHGLLCMEWLNQAYHWTSHAEWNISYPSQDPYQ